MILNPGTATVSDKTMATTVEAILGAVHLDQGEPNFQAVLSTLGLGHEYLPAVTSSPFPRFLRTDVIHTVTINLLLDLSMTACQIAHVKVTGFSHIIEV